MADEEDDGDVGAGGGDVLSSAFQGGGGGLGMGDGSLGGPSLLDPAASATPGVTPDPAAPTVPAATPPAAPAPVTPAGPATVPDGVTANLNANKPIDRSQFAAELQNPEVMKAFAGRIQSEVGGQGVNAQIAFTETVFNRAAARGQTLMQTLSGNYFPTSNPGSSSDPKLANVVNFVAQNGTNITNGATGNASGTVGFGGGPQTYASNGERFGVEAADHNWTPTYAARNPDYNGLKVAHTQDSPAPAAAPAPVTTPPVVTAAATTRVAPMRVKGLTA